jgi:hypothetical protein
MQDIAWVVIIPYFQVLGSSNRNGLIASHGLLANSVYTIQFQPAEANKMDEPESNSYKINYGGPAI